MLMDLLNSFLITLVGYKAVHIIYIFTAFCWISIHRVMQIHNFYLKYFSIILRFLK